MNHRDGFLFPHGREEGPTSRPAGSADTPWRQGWELTEEEIAFYRERSVTSREAKKRALSGKGCKPVHPINEPRLDPSELMPRMPPNGLRSLSLFSGGGGLDLGFDLAGFDHAASYDILPVVGETLLRNRPGWTVFAGDPHGDVCRQDWRVYRDAIDVLHGGPPCQPFSMAGRQLGSRDTRDMFPQFVRAVLECRPRAFAAENVAALGHSKFLPYLEEVVFRPLSKFYRIERFELRAERFGIPQTRVRLFIIGFRSASDFKQFVRPKPTHEFRSCRANRPAEDADLFRLSARGNDAALTLQRTMGVREALGLPDLGCDDLSPTLRSGFTGPRGATSVNSSTAALRAWDRLKIWPHGVAVDRKSAHLFVPENQHFRLSLPDCNILQGFPETWPFAGRVWSILGQIGNSVVPPVAYQLAISIAKALAN